MGHGIVFGITDGGVLEVFEFETGAGIIEAIHEHFFGADVGNANFEIGIEMAAPLDGVVEQFAKGVTNFFEHVFGEYRTRGGRENFGRD